MNPSTDYTYAATQKTLSNNVKEFNDLVNKLTALQESKNIPLSTLSKLTKISIIQLDDIQTHRIAPTFQELTTIENVLNNA